MKLEKTGNGYVVLHVYSKRGSLGEVEGLLQEVPRPLWDLTIPDSHGDGDLSLQFTCFTPCQFIIVIVYFSFVPCTHFWHGLEAQFIQLLTPSSNHRRRESRVV